MVQLEKFGRRNVGLISSNSPQSIPIFGNTYLKQLAVGALSGGGFATESFCVGRVRRVEQLRALLVAPYGTVSVVQECAFRNVRNGRIQVRREVFFPLLKSTRQLVRFFLTLLSLLSYNVWRLELLEKAQ